MDRRQGTRGVIEGEMTAPSFGGSNGSHAPPPEVLVDLPPGYHTLPEYLGSLVHFLRQWQHLYSFHATDMLTKGWAAGESQCPLPAEGQWGPDMAPLTVQECIDLASCPPDRYAPRPEWPASLQHVLTFLKCQALPRSGSRVQAALEARLPPLERAITYGMNPKKRHEVRLLAGLIAAVCATRDIRHVLDIGAGQGYLDAALGHTYGLNVVGVDDDTVQTCGARAKAAKISVHRKRSANVTHINRRIRADEHFDDLLRMRGDALDAEGTPGHAPSPEVERNRWLTCCLHACGDLTVFMLRQFVQGEAVALVTVGCCFNLLTERDLTGESMRYQRAAADAALYPPLPEDHDPGYPMSAWMRAQDMPLGITSRMLACQATPKWSLDPALAAHNLDKHFYRAVLQYLIQDLALLPHVTDSREIVVGKLPRSATLQGFPHYARLALCNLGLHEATANLPDAMLQGYHDLLLPRKGALVFAWTVRALFSGILESLILCDRLLYLLEAHGVDVHTPVRGAASALEAKVIDSISPGEELAPLDPGQRYAVREPRSGAGPAFALFPLFEQETSPRNMVLLALKGEGGLSTPSVTFREACTGADVRPAGACALKG